MKQPGVVRLATIAVGAALAVGGVAAVQGMGTTREASPSTVTAVDLPSARPPSGGRARVGPAAAAAPGKRPPPVHRARVVHRSEAPVAVALSGTGEVPVEAVGTTPDGRLDVPGDIRAAGWWRGGSRIGDPFGTTVIAAHVDSTTQGLGPFAALLSVRAGHRVEVRSAHQGQIFEVASLTLVPRGSLARNGWIFATGGARRLILVTCAPPYVAGAGGYQNLAVVTATPIAGPYSRRT